jgi:uncharacterized membrane protein
MCQELRSRENKLNTKDTNYNIELMAFSLVKAIKSTHRSPVNLFLHFLGLSLYIAGLFLIIRFLIGMDTNPIEGTALWGIAVVLFVIGHKVEGNLRSTTPVVVFKFLMSKI